MCLSFLSETGESKYVPVRLITSDNRRWMIPIGKPCAVQSLKICGLLSVTTLQEIFSHAKKLKLKNLEIDYASYYGPFVDNVTFEDASESICEFISHNPSVENMRLVVNITNNVCLLPFQTLIWLGFFAAC